MRVVQCIGASSQSRCLLCGRHLGVLAARRYRSRSREQATCSAWFVVFLSGRAGTEMSCSSHEDILLRAGTTGNRPLPKKERAFHPHNWKSEAFRRGTPVNSKERKSSS